MITLVSRSDTTHGPLMARFTHEYGKFRFRSTWPLTQRRSWASPSGSAPGGSISRCPFISLPSISPFATYFPKSSSLAGLPRLGPPDDFRGTRSWTGHRGDCLDSAGANGPAAPTVVVGKGVARSTNRLRSIPYACPSCPPPVPTSAIAWM